MVEVSCGYPLEFSRVEVACQGLAFRKGRTWTLVESSCSEPAGGFDGQISEAAEEGGSSGWAPRLVYSAVVGEGRVEVGGDFVEGESWRVRESRARRRLTFSTAMQAVMMPPLSLATMVTPGGGRWSSISEVREGDDARLGSSRRTEGRFQ